MNGEFVAYVGPSNLHDATIRNIASEPNNITVFIEASVYEKAAGPNFALHFYGVTHHYAVEPKGMMLYALIEMRCEPPLRKFSFANSEDDAARLEIIARGFDVLYSGYET